MEKVKSCQFNMDTATVNIAYENGNNIVLYTAWVENRLNLTAITKDKLTWLLDNEPMIYAEQALGGTLQEYLNRYEKRSDDCEGGIKRSLENHYSPEIARQIAREMMMYG